MPDDSLQPVQRLTAYAVLRDAADSVTLVRASQRSDVAGRWFLPGGGLLHGEHPQDAVVRETAEEVGIAVRVTALREVLSDVIELPDRGLSVHTLRVIYDVEPVNSDWLTMLRVEPDGTSDDVGLVAPSDLTALPLMPFVAAALGVPVSGACGGPVVVTHHDGVASDRPHPDGGSAPAEPGDPADGAEQRPVPVQRPGAYAIVEDAGRMLLTRLEFSGMWTLPGGGIDHGESPLDAVRRELHEETGLPLSDIQLIDVDSAHFTGHAPDGTVEDFHALRVIYAGTVPTGSQPHVVEVGGSTDAAAWIAFADLDTARLTATALNARRYLR